MIGGNGASPRQAVFSAVQTFHDRSASDICFALVLVASALEHPVVYSANDKPIDLFEVHKAIAALFADIYAYEKTFGEPPSCKNLSEFWRLTNEAYFRSHA